MTDSLRRSLIELVTQWKSDGLECVAFGYRPLDRQQQLQCFYSLDEHSVFVIDPEQIDIPHGSPFNFNHGVQNDIRHELIQGLSPFGDTNRATFKENHRQPSNHYQQQQQQTTFDLPQPTTMVELSFTQQFLNDSIKHEYQQQFSSFHNMTNPISLLSTSQSEIDSTLINHNHLISIDNPLQFLSPLGLQTWNYINIFPGPRSSIGGTPVIQLCSVPSYSVTTNSNSYFINYNNLVRQIIPLSVYFPSRSPIHTIPSMSHKWNIQETDNIPCEKSSSKPSRILTDTDVTSVLSTNVPSNISSGHSTSSSSHMQSSEYPSLRSFVPCPNPSSYSSFKSYFPNHHRFQLDNRILDLNTFISFPSPQTASIHCPLLVPQFSHFHLTNNNELQFCNSTLPSYNMIQSYPSESSSSNVLKSNHTIESTPKILPESSPDSDKIVNPNILMRRLINKQIFLGMVALKLSTSQELATRVASFHEVRGIPSRSNSSGPLNWTLLLF